MDVHARSGPIVMRLGHERGVELVGPRRGLHRTLQQQAVESRGHGIGAMLEIDLELTGAGLLHDGVDREILNLADAVNVVDDGRERVQLLEAEGQRPARIVGKTFGWVKHGGAVCRPAGDIELEFDRRDRRAARARETLDLIDEHCARVDLVLAVDHHHRLGMPAVSDRDRHQRPAQKVAMVVPVAGFPQPAGLFHAIAERIHDEDRGRHHQPVPGDAGQIGTTYALAARNAIHVK